MQRWSCWRDAWQERRPGELKRHVGAGSYGSEPDEREIGPGSSAGLMGNDCVAQGEFEKAPEGRCGKVDSGCEERFRFWDRLVGETGLFDRVRDWEAATVGRVGVGIGRMG
jgi:hypothetical protein